MDRLTESLDWFTHGWHAFVGAWFVVIFGMWAGLWLRGANRGRYLTAPIAAAFIALPAMLAAARITRRPHSPAIKPRSNTSG